MTQTKVDMIVEAVTQDKSRIGLGFTEGAKEIAREAIRMTVEKIRRKISIIHTNQECDCWHGMEICGYGELIEELGGWLGEGEER